jgi:diguanylate cyclase (GGDEF)-like protein
LLRGPRQGPLWPELVVPAPAAARQLVIIFAISGLLAFVGSASSDTVHPRGFVAVGVVDLVVAAVASLNGWRRWHGIWVLALGVGTALPVIAAVGRLDPLAPSMVFLVLLFVWVGANFPPGTVWWLLPLTAASFVYEIAPADTRPSNWIPTLTVVLAGSVIVAETISRAIARVSAAEADSRARATQLRVLADSAGALNSLDADRVMDAAVGALIRLGHDAAGVALIDGDTGRLRTTHAHGVVPDATDPAERGGGVAGRALNLDATVVETEYPSSAEAVPAVVRAGFQTVIATPVRVDDVALGALFCAAKADWSRTVTDPEPVELLAAHVGRALGNAAEYAQQLRAAVQHATEANTDPLTGVGNRRHADAMLASLAPGDALVLFDLDHFKSVNDTRGHAVGDKVLQDFARFLRSHVRAGDSVARFGGEEFLVVLRGTEPEVDATGVRMVEAWRATRPVATVSAGLAIHPPDGTAAETLARADAALYTAKTGGRDRLVAGTG